jgi:hypothetical protein
VRAAVEAIVSQPLDKLGDALKGFTWQFEAKVRSSRQQQPRAG